MDRLQSENNELSQNLNQEIEVLKSSIVELTKAVNEKDAQLQENINAQNQNAELKEEIDKIKTELQKTIDQKNELDQRYVEALLITKYTITML